MYKCSVCDKEYENRHVFLGHCSSHKRTKKIKTEKIKISQTETKKYCCNYCGEMFDNCRKFGAHTVNCKSDPEYLNKSKIRSKKISDAMKNRTSEICKKIGEKASLRIKEKVTDGTWHYSFSKTRTHDYNGVKLHGMWELQFAKWLDKNNIEWRRPKEKFYYELNNKSHYYTPDFYLIATSEYIEIKGYETEKDRAKWKWFPYKLVVYKKNDLYKLNIINKSQYDGKT